MKGLINDLRFTLKRLFTGIVQSKLTILKTEIYHQSVENVMLSPEQDFYN